MLEYQILYYLLQYRYIYKLSKIRYQCFFGDTYNAYIFCSCHSCTINSTHIIQMNSEKCHHTGSNPNTKTPESCKKVTGKAGEFSWQTSPQETPQSPLGFRPASPLGWRAAGVRSRRADCGSDCQPGKCSMSCPMMRAGRNCCCHPRS